MVAMTWSRGGVMATEELLLRLNLCAAAYDFSVGMMLAGGLLTGIIARRDS